MVQKTAFCGVPGINKNLQITQDSSPWDIFEVFFSPELFKLIQKETNRLCKAANKQKETRGLSVAQICICTVEYSLTTRNKKIICNNHTHGRVTQVTSAGLLDFCVQLFTPHTQLLLECLGIGSLHY
jgi:hypothetical protein